MSMMPRTTPDRTQVRAPQNFCEKCLKRPEFIITKHFGVILLLFCWPAVNVVANNPKVAGLSVQRVFFLTPQSLYPSAIK